eukprot:SAG31_NODE_3950_length_3724_cov_3.097655_2_plen_31_part_01
MLESILFNIPRHPLGLNLFSTIHNITRVQLR